MAGAIIVLAMALLKITTSAHAPMKDAIRTRFDPDSKSFWDTEEIEHLYDDTLNLFSCFVEQKGNCQYYKPNFDSKCVGCTVTDGTVSFDSPGSKVVITGDDVTKIDTSTVIDPVTATSKLHIVNVPHLVQIQPDLFEKFPNVEELIVFNAGITSALNVSSPLKKLINMAILRSKVDRISGNSFLHMGSLERLNLACNNISFVADDAFKGLGSLVRLNLGRNALEYIPIALSSIKDTVEYIGLEFNNIMVLPAFPFKGMTSLAHVNLTGNDIEVIEPGWMDDCSSLRFIELGYNNISKLAPFSISDGDQLTYITVSENSRLTSIDGNAFNNLGSLKVLDILGNQRLENIDYRAFNNIPKLKYIDMSSNKLSSFPHAPFIHANFTNVEKLWMQGNKIATLSDISDKALNDITDILNNRFKDVYPLYLSFSLLKKLDSLDLSNNKLTVIPNGVLHHATKVSFLELSNNRLHTIEEEAFVDMSLQTLYLNDNFLLEVPRALFKVKSLKVLKLNNNLLTYLKRGTLLNLDMTNKLYLENNQILAIEDDALPRSLTFINLSNNRFDFVDENQFNNMPDLLSINFQYNRISYLPRDAFKNNEKLTTIYLSDNNINWIENGPFSTTSSEIELLNMERNSLAFVENGTFSSKSIKEVRLKENDLHDWPQDGSLSFQTKEFYAEFAQNKFEVIRTGMFQNHSKFQKADFEENHISDVEEYAFHNLNIDYDKKKDDIFGVMLINNPVSNLEPFSFTNITSPTVGKGLDNHAGLHLEDITTLFTLRTNTFNSIELDYIFLNNGKIKLIETHSFNGIKLHWTLQFNNGPLQYVAKKAIKATWIKFIQFNENKIRKLPLGAFEEIEDCQNFNIENNEINFIDTDSLPNCSGKFNFQHNQITHVVVDAFRKADSITNLQFTSNAIIKIEDGAMDTFAGKVQQLLLNKNNLPQIPDNLLQTASLDTLNLDDNKPLRTIGLQEIEGSDSGTMVTDNNQGAFIDASIYKNVKKNAKNILVYGVNDCTCNLVQTIANINAKTGTTISVKGPSKCAYGDNKELNINDNAPTNARNKLHCEPYTTRLERVSLSFVDEIPTSESLTVYWRFPEAAIWGNTVYCCEDRANSGCITQASVVMKCLKQASDSGNGEAILETDPFTVQLRTSDTCDKEFSHSVDIDFSTETSVFIFCSVQIAMSGAGQFSAFGPWRVGYRQELETTEKIPESQRTIAFQATYFDLTNDFEDFQNMGYDKIYRNPKMFDSPSVGPYLYTENKLEGVTDTVTQWFTPNSHVDDILQEEFYLKSCPGFGAASHCMFARQWWPVDSIVSELKDTTANFKRHNMYFTARLRLAVQLSGREVLSIGGPDDVWVFMNGTLVLELLAEEEDKAELPCGELSFHEEAGRFVVRYGTINRDIVDESQVGRCTLIGEQSEVEAGEFTVADEMYVDIFTTQRRSLSSLLYLRLTEFQPRDFSNHAAFFMSERKISSGKVDELDFRTVLGSQSFTVDIVGTENNNDNFEIHNSDYEWKEDPEPPQVNQRPGQGIPDFYNCSETVEPVPVVQPIHTSILTTSTVLVILRNALDYEEMGEKYKYLYLEVHYVFEGKNTRDYVTKLRIKVTVEDANDNCPVFQDQEDLLIDRSDLCLDFRGTLLNVTDADNGLNKAVQYFIGSYEVLNLNSSEYEMYKNVDDYFTYETFRVKYRVEVYGVDRGPVRLGTKHHYLFLISASCIQDMTFIVGIDSAIFNVKAPGWMISQSNLGYCDTCTLGYRCPGFGTRVQCTTCRQDFLNEELDKKIFDELSFPRNEEGCVNRSNFEISFGGQYSCSECKPGWRCREGEGVPVEQLERESGYTVGTHYINLCTGDSGDNCTQEMKLCEAGYLCRAGVTEKCPAGQYSSAGSSSCSFCPPGQFSPQEGATNCTCCEGGMESTHAKQSCDYCPENEISGGCEMCRSCTSKTECPCLADISPCSSGVQCVNLPGNKYTCLSCPTGFEDNGDGCVDIDECVRFTPCFEELNVACTNTVPGFKCDSCPTGYTGNAPQGIGEPEEKQYCHDIDECATNNGNCDINSECINKPGYYYCGYCFGQFVGNGTIPCKSGDYCSSGRHTCDDNAKCTVTGPAGYVCECNIMYAGNGTACGVDTDGDNFPDFGINCQGSTCVADICATLPNTDQVDTDKDGLGDECDTDIDGDLSINEKDKCPLNSNITSDPGDHVDSDGDGWLDECDNCVSDINEDQYDTDGNGVGDVCDTCQDEDCFTDLLPDCTDNSGKDSDGDGVDDNCDNCVFVANSAQRDIDGDQVGDSCDDDIDGDSIPNTEDNCVYLDNPGQENKDKDFKGDLCDDSKSWPQAMVNDADADGDGLPDVDDICPFDKTIRIRHFNFTISQLIDLSLLSKPESIRWKVRSNGRDVDLEASHYDKADLKTRLYSPIALLGETRFDEVQFEGTFFVRNNVRFPTPDTGSIGIIFGYQELKKKDNQKQKIVRFYQATWRHDYHTFNNCGENERLDCYYGATTGLQIKAVTIHSTSTEDNRRELVWWSAPTTGSSDKITTELIYQDPQHVTWEFNRAYRWRLEHRPSTGRIQMSIHTVEEGRVETVVDTQHLYNKRIQGGRLGVLSIGQWNLTFSNVAAKCLLPENGAALFNGQSHVINLGNLQGLGVKRSFQISAWFKISVAPDDGSIYPIVCKNRQTSTQKLCVFITSDLKLRGDYAGSVVEAEGEVSLNTWFFFIIRYDMQYKTVRLYHNIGGVKLYTQSEDFVNLAPLNEEVFLGSDGDNFYRGYLDEVRVLHRLIHEDDYLYTLMFKPSLAREQKMRLVGAHLNFDRETISDVLGNIQITELNSDSALLPDLAKSNVLGQMNRYDEANRGELEKLLYQSSDGTPLRKRREISSRRKKRRSVCTGNCGDNSHDEL